MAWSADGVSLFNACFHADGIIDIIFKHRADCLIFFQREFIQRNIFFNAEKDKASNNAMGITEWNSVAASET